MAQKTLHDFSELANLRTSFSQEETSKEREAGLRKRRDSGNDAVISKANPPVWPIIFEFNHYLDAVASIVKNYPLLSSVRRKFVFQNSRDSLIIRVGKGDRVFVFSYKPQIFRRVFKCRERFTAFKVILFTYAELRRINHLHISVLEDVSVGNFVLYLDEIPILAASYSLYNGLQKQMKSFKDSICAGHQAPNTEYEDEAKRFGENLVKRIEDAPFQDIIPIIPTFDYSKFEHNETVRVSSRENKVVERVSYGKTLSGPAVLPSMMNWDDRFDHDD